MISLRVGLLPWVLVLASGCQEERTPLGPPPPCKAGDTCSVAAGGIGAGSGGGGGGGGEGQGGSSATGHLSGKVAILDSDTFATTAPYDGSASVLALLTASTVTADYDGMTPFTFEGLPTGSVWLLAKPEPVGALLPVFTVHQVPASNVVAPVLDVDVLNGIAVTLQGQPFPLPAAAQIVLKVARSGLPLPGVSVVGDAGDATIAYDEGQDVFSTDAPGTGAGGIVLLLNAFGPANPETMTLTLQDEALTEYPIKFPITAGAVTFASYELQ